jgi:hypothetical protein
VVKINDAGMVFYSQSQIFLKINDCAVIGGWPTLHTNTAIATGTVKTKKEGHGSRNTVTHYRLIQLAVTFSRKTTTSRSRNGGRGWDPGCRHAWSGYED